MESWKGMLPSMPIIGAASVTASMPESDVSMLLGEANAISILQDQAQTFNEKFTVHFTKLDGTPATLSNQ
jgi:hypothetical protein